MTSTPEHPEADARLVAAHDLARAALAEVTPASTVGDAAGYTLEGDGVVSLRFANRLAGYPGWYWTVSVAVVEGAEPTVLEVELLPGDGALLAPEWVPWATRLAEYQAAQAAQDEAEADHDDSDDDDDAEDDSDDIDDDDEDDDDIEDLDAADFDTDGSPILHAGDVDGVDIDELDEDSEDDEDSVDDDSDDEDSDDDDSDDEGSDDEGSDDDREDLREY